MTKNFFFAAMAAVALVFGFTSCSKDDDDEVEKTPVTVKLDMEAQMNETIKSLCDLNVTYAITVADGRTAEKTVTANSGLYINNLECPCTMTFNYSFAPKKDVTINEAQTYTLEYGPSFTVESSTNSIVMRGTKQSITIDGSKLKAYLDRICERVHEITFTVDKEGSISVKE